MLFGTSFRELESERPDVASALQDAMTDRLAADLDATAPSSTQAADAD
jgi:hypothetical protein